jgi:hypothetical protein
MCRHHNHNRDVSSGNLSVVCLLQPGCGSQMLRPDQALSTHVSHPFAKFVVSETLAHHRARTRRGWVPHAAAAIRLLPRGCCKWRSSAGRLQENLPLQMPGCQLVWLQLCGA